MKNQIAIKYKNHDYYLNVSFDTADAVEREAGILKGASSPIPGGYIIVNYAETFGVRAFMLKVLKLANPTNRNGESMSENEIKEWIQINPHITTKLMLEFLTLVFMGGEMAKKFTAVLNEKKASVPDKSAPSPLKTSQTEKIGASS